MMRLKGMMYRPRKVVQDKELQRRVKDIAKMLCPNHGHTIYIVEQDCGKYYHADKVILIPLWTTDKEREEGFLLYYVSHELSHIDSLLHDEKFYNTFKKLCPVEYQKFEWAYKPSCVRYGVGKK